RIVKPTIYFVERKRAGTVQTDRFLVVDHLTAHGHGFLILGVFGLTCRTLGNQLSIHPKFPPCARNHTFCRIHIFLLYMFASMSISSIASRMVTAMRINTLSPVSARRIWSSVIPDTSTPILLR